MLLPKQSPTDWGLRTLKSTMSRREEQKPSPFEARRKDMAQEVIYFQTLIHTRYQLLFEPLATHVQKSTMMNWQDYPLNETQALYQQCAQSLHSTKVFLLIRELLALQIQQTGALLRHL